MNSIHCQVGEERLDQGFGREEVLARPHAVETDESYDPFYIGSLGVDGVMLQTEHLSHFIEEFWWLTSCHGGHRRFPSWRSETADNRHRAKLPENQSNITLSGLLAIFGEWRAREPQRGKWRDFPSVTARFS
jgi:hypothetical protein